MKRERTAFVWLAHSDGLDLVMIPQRKEIIEEEHR